MAFFLSRVNGPRMKRRTRRDDDCPDDRNGACILWNDVIFCRHNTKYSSYLLFCDSQWRNSLQRRNYDTVGTKKKFTTQITPMRESPRGAENEAQERIIILTQHILCHLNDRSKKSDKTWNKLGDVMFSLSIALLQNHKTTKTTKTSASFTQRVPFATK